MAVVVSDTSPIQALANVGLLHVLPRIFGQVMVPPAVVAELAKARLGSSPVLVDQMPFIIVRAPSDAAMVDRLRLELHPGEAEAIALAVELGVDSLLIDELDGRAVASRYGIRTIGAMGILLKFKECHYISEVAPLIERLRKVHQFRLSAKLIANTLRLAGELPADSE